VVVWIRLLLQFDDSFWMRRDVRRIQADAQMPTSKHATISRRNMRKLTIKISELVFPAIAKRRAHVKLQICEDQMFSPDYFEPRNRSSGTGTEKLTCMTSPMIRRHELAANGIHDFTCEMRRGV